MRSASVVNDAYVFRLEDVDHFRRRRSGSEVNVAGTSTHQQIADRAAGDAQLVIVTPEDGGKMLEFRREKRAEVGIIGVDEARRCGWRRRRRIVDRDVC